MANYWQILNDWNFWSKKIDTGKKRKEYLDKLMKLSEMPEIIAVSGVRRSGKSTILLQLIRELYLQKKIPYENTLYVNFEDPRLENVLEAKDLFDLTEEYKNKLRPKGKIYLFLDEVQNVDRWEKFVRTLYDQKENIKIFVTGSTSTTFDSDFSRVLSGRMLVLKVFPLNFREFLDFKGVKGTSPKINLLLDEYLQYGGFPRVVLEENEINKRLLLISYYDTIIEKDVILKNDIKNKLELKQIARFVITNIANQISSYSLEKTLKISNVNIGRYLSFLEDSFIISRVPLFSYSVKKQIYNPDKVFCTDTGIARVAGFGFSENKGKLLENIVFRHLQESGGQIYYWKNKSEVDFLIFTKATVEKLINVTLTVDDPEVLRREIASLEEGSKEFKSAKLLLLTLYNESRQNDERISLLVNYLLGR